METEATALSPPDESAAIRAAITKFLHDRLQIQLKKVDTEEEKDKGKNPTKWQQKREKLNAEHAYHVWIDKASKDVMNIQQATHVAKFGHPSASGATNLLSLGNEKAYEHEVGTHSIVAAIDFDIATTDAKYLPAYSLLMIEVGGKTLLQRSQSQDAALAKALSDDTVKAQSWMAAFATLAEAKGRPASHTLARQIYWPVEGGYHLLAPLFASSLAQAVHSHFTSHSDSKEVDKARKAKRDGKYCDRGFRDYPNHAKQSFGGENGKQNISKGNSKRGGVSYLIANFPPAWRSEALKPPLKTETVFTDRSYFAFRAEVRRVLPALRDFLDRLPENINNQPIRDAIQGLAQALVDEVLHMAAELRELEPGWSAGAQCQLNRCEQLWLDPARSKTDEEFAQEYTLGAWRDELCERFSLWLNRQLQTKSKTFGADEARYWSSQLEAELKLLREDMSDD